MLQQTAPLFAGAILVLALLSAPAIHAVNVTVGPPGPLPYMKQGAVVKVVFDDKPVPGFTVHIRRHFGSQEDYLLTTDDAGAVKLPQFPPGSYSIYASSPDIDVCVEMCMENGFELTEFGFDDLRGPIYEIDRSALGMSEITIETAPDRQFLWKGTVPLRLNATILEAERQPATLTLQRLCVAAVTDVTGAVIGGASVAVMRKGQKENELVTALTTDQTGACSVPLDPGDYFVVVWAQGFRSKTIHVVISPQGSADGARIILDIDNLPLTINVSEYRPSMS
jgi:hypothetical protein